MNSESNFKNSRVHKLQLAKRIPEQLKGYWKINHNGKYTGIAMIR